jgi:hypothetical protein
VVRIGWIPQDADDAPPAPDKAEPNPHPGRLDPRGKWKGWVTGTLCKTAIWTDRDGWHFRCTNSRTSTLRHVYAGTITVVDGTIEGVTRVLPKGYATGQVTVSDDKKQLTFDIHTNGPGREAGFHFKVLRGAKRLDFDLKKMNPNIIHIGFDGTHPPSSVFSLPVGDPVAAAPSDGFVSLFNGKDLTGWKTHPKQRGNWSVENGVLIGRGPAISHLYSERGDYENVHFRTEVRINAGGDSGQYVRSSFGPLWGKGGWPTGYEADIGGAGCLVIGEQDAQQFVDYPGPPWLKTVRAARWTTHDVIAVGNRITVKIDGREVLNWTDPKLRFSRGHLALQIGNEPGTVVEFRKLEVKELPP